MRAITIGYHDVLDRQRAGQEVISPSLTVYTLDEQHFQDHLLAIAQRHAAVTTINRCSSWKTELPRFLTFDDGAIGAYTCSADALERYRWRGHFFITTNWIGCPGYMDRDQIRELYHRGHVIGSHSCSHPERMSCLSTNELLQQWKDSCAILSDIVGDWVRVASVPGGYYSRQVALTAAAAGIEVLFNSEPTTATSWVRGCLVLGRYCIQRYTPPEVSGSIAAGQCWPRWQQSLLWGVKKIAKAVGGESYLSIRRRLLSRSMPKYPSAENPSHP